MCEKKREILMELRDDWEQIIKMEKDIYIYGAGKFGKKLLGLLRRYGKDESVRGFLVTDMKDNAEMVDDKPVIQVDCLDDKKALILLAVSDRYQEEMMKKLQELQFYNIVNAYKYTFLEDENSDSVEVIEVNELIKKQYEGEKFLRYDIIVRLLAIEEYFEKNSYGMSLYKKMQNERIHPNYADVSVERFERLINSCKKSGFDTDSEILVDSEMRLMDGSHRVALALYYGLSYIKLRVVNEISTADFSMNWFETRFDSEECQKILERYEVLKNQLGNEKKSALEKLTEKIYCILGKNQDFDQGTFYQSLEELNIKGQRPTAERIEKYGLKELVQGKKVLDIGCNCGFIDLSLGLLAQSVDGVEYNGTLVKIANEVRDFLKRENVHFETGDFKEYRTNKKFDVIFSFAVHYWIGLSAEEYCKRIVSLLEQDGYLIFESQNIETVDVDFEKYCHQFEKNGMKKIREGQICDDGEITRRFLVYKYVG